LFQPQTYEMTLSLMLLSMLSGIVANTSKCAVLSVSALLLGLRSWSSGSRLAVGFTLGSSESSGRPFLADLLHTGSSHILFAMAGGAIFNAANLLLVTAIDMLTGGCISHGIGLALVVGAISSYLLSPNGNPIMLFGGIALV